MHILRTSPPSPFGRQIKIAAKHLGLMDRIAIEPADTMNPEDTLRQQNPLGKIPILITEDGLALYDSRVILDYLDHMAGGGKIVPADETRFAVSVIQSLANGITDAAILIVYEGRYRAADMRVATWVEYQSEKIARGLSTLEACPPPLDGDIHIGHIAIAAALGYQDFRFDGHWREGHPNLVAWLEAFAAKVPAFAETMPE